MQESEETPEQRARRRVPEAMKLVQRFRCDLVGAAQMAAALGMDPKTFRKDCPVHRFRLNEDASGNAKWVQSRAETAAWLIAKYGEDGEAGET